MSWFCGGKSSVVWRRYRAAGGHRTTSNRLWYEELQDSPADFGYGAGDAGSPLMSATPQILTAWIAVVVAGFGCGWVLRMAGPAEPAPPVRVIPAAKETPVKSPLTELPPVASLDEVLAASTADRAGMLARHLRTANVAELKALYEKEWTAEFRDLIMLRWTAIDPASAMEVLYGGAMRYWCINDPEAAYAWTLKNNKGREEIEKVCKWVAESDPPRVLRWLANDPVARWRWKESELVKSLESFIAKQSGVEAAVRFSLRHLTKPGDSLLQWAAKDPEAAVRCLLKEGDPVLQYEVISSLTSRHIEGTGLSPEILRRAAAIIPGPLKSRLTGSADFLEKHPPSKE